MMRALEEEGSATNERQTAVCRWGVSRQMPQNKYAAPIFARIKKETAFCNGLKSTQFFIFGRYLYLPSCRIASSDYIF